VIGVIEALYLILQVGPVGAAALAIAPFWGATFGAGLIAICGLLPASLVIAYAELRRIQSWLFYVLGAPLLSSLVAVLFTSATWFFQYLPPDRSRTDFASELLPTLKLAAIVPHKLALDEFPRRAGA
jgi:hypothetical protein